MRCLLSWYCFLWFKDTKMKANHNPGQVLVGGHLTVSCGSKILKWKQITTLTSHDFPGTDCFLWFKDTKMKANHNAKRLSKMEFITVSCGSKILKWKQITTSITAGKTYWNCFLWFKDTKMKANHNQSTVLHASTRTVSCGSKILKWKQITTYTLLSVLSILLFPVVQRY